MKRNLVLLSLAAILAVTAGLAYAGAGTAMRITVPFDFYLEDQLLPAGDYRIEMGSGFVPTASRVTIRAVDGTGIRILLTLSETGSGDDSSYLKFNRYGERYFLSSVSIGDHKAKVKMYTLEKELRSQNQESQVTTLVAQK